MYCCKRTAVHSSRPSILCTVVYELQNIVTIVHFSTLLYKAVHRSRSCLQFENHLKKYKIYIIRPKPTLPLFLTTKTYLFMRLPQKQLESIYLSFYRQPLEEQSSLFLFCCANGKIVFSYGNILQIFCCPKLNRMLKKKIVKHYL